MNSRGSAPFVLYRYDHREDREIFFAALKDGLEICACQSDPEARSEIETRAGQLVAIVLDVESANSPLPAMAKKLNPNALSILLHQNIALDSIVSMLDSGLTDRCFAKPYDSNIVRSEIYTASLFLNKSTILNHCYPEIDKKYTALIVDDETVATKFLVKQLNRLGCPCDVLVADSAEQALELFEARKDQLAIIISDQRMPGIQGNQLLSEIQKYSPHAVRILTSAYEEVDIALNAVNEGRISRYIKKPWDGGEINNIIKLSLSEFRSRIAQAYAAQNLLAKQYQSVLLLRQTQLRQVLIRQVDDFAGSGSLDYFFDCLNHISVLPPGSASLRASQQTDIESQLVHAFCQCVRDRLECLADRVDSSNQTVRLTAINSLDCVLADLSSTSLGRELVTCLENLLDSSDLDFHALAIADADQGWVMHTKADQGLSLFRHILSAQTQVSQQMLEQQCNMLVLVLLCRKLGFDILIGGGEQQFSISILLSRGEGHTLDRKGCST